MLDQNKAPVAQLSELNERYRHTVKDHPDCIAMTKMVDDANPIFEYERGFFRHITPN